MPIVAFDVVAAALARLERAGTKRHGNSLDECTTQRLLDLGSKYSRLSSAKKPIIDYSDVATHMAYLYGYVPAHANFVSTILSEGRSEAARPLFSSKVIYATSIGGGPGSDLVGLMKFLLRRPGREPVRRVRLRILDKEPAWKAVCEALIALLNADIEIDLEFIEFDATAADLNSLDWAEEDIVMMSFFVSEVCCLGSTGNLEEFFGEFLGDLPKGAWVLYNDNRDPAFRDFFDRMLATAGRYEVVVSEDAGDMRLDSSEQASTLIRYKERFGGRSTKLTGRTSYRLAERE